MTTTTNSSDGSWFVRVRHGYSEWVEGPFREEADAHEHARLRTVFGRGAPQYELRTVRLESLDAEDIIDRLAGWIEENVEGTQVYRKSGMVVT